MDSKVVRKLFLDFFAEKHHHIVSSAPMVVKDDPTLMFTNAGMNQFKDIFLGNTAAKFHRIANSQKCLRVSGKHNDLEEVGHDTYHHTMFEMLGNWSFGDYFKKEAIEWAWELLTGRYKIDSSCLYATVFGGDDADALPWDEEAYGYWSQILPADRILKGSKKDNFWEMGDTGPCGPCSEIHIDLRSDEEKELLSGCRLVNQGHPLVIEIWNLVFIQFNRQADGKLSPLPARHVDTGMGFERLCMALQHVKSNYDTDVFKPYIRQIEELSGVIYGSNQGSDVAMRVISDHLRAVAFAIADGQLPSNNKAGYVIRRILRRAVRYAYSYLNQKDPFIHRLVPVICEQMGESYPELLQQQGLIEKVIHEEEASFLRTLMQGIQKFSQHISANQTDKTIEGTFAFELYDTYGFPIDLTQLLAKEQGWPVDMEGFATELEKQKQRSRQDAAMETGDWVVLEPSTDTKFVGWDTTSAMVRLLRYRKVNIKGKDYYHVLFDTTPFYAESGGQSGDTGYLLQNSIKYRIADTRKENNLLIHILETLPADPYSTFEAVVDSEKRTLTANNHSATHLLHQALRNVLGLHVEQKGSFVGPDYLRFDFSHFQKLSEAEIRQVEMFVNQKIRQNLTLNEHRDLPLEKARDLGAIMFFGEKYGETVRAIGFGESLELCGGTHVASTGQIGIFKIISEGAIAAGIRRIEALTGTQAEEHIEQKLAALRQIGEMVKNTTDPVKAVASQIEHSDQWQKKVDELSHKLAHVQKEHLLATAQMVGKFRLIASRTDLDPQTIKDMAHMLRLNQQRLVMALASIKDGKVNLSLFISDDIVKDHLLNAGTLVRELAREIDGGGGGQPYFATAGGKKPEGIDTVFKRLKELVAGL